MGEWADYWDDGRRDWDGLGDDELLERLIRRGTSETEARQLVAHREGYDDVRYIITRALAA